MKKNGEIRMWRAGRESRRREKAFEKGLGVYFLLRRVDNNSLFINPALIPVAKTL